MELTLCTNCLDFEAVFEDQYGEYPPYTQFFACSNCGKEL